MNLNSNFARVKLQVRAVVKVVHKADGNIHSQINSQFRVKMIRQMTSDSTQYGLKDEIVEHVIFFSPNETLARQDFNNEDRLGTDLKMPEFNIDESFAATNQ